MSAASDRLASFYNGLAYNASTNAGGLAQGGHRTNFVPALQDVATVAGEVATNATSAASSASSASSSATAAAASASALSGTSATSIAIGTGSKTFTTQASKFFNVGAWVNIRSAANPTINYMIAQVTAYAGTTLTTNVTVTGGSGTFSDWTIELASAPGQTGSTGSTGALGPSPAIQFNFSTGITDADPGNGLFKFDSATFAAVQWVYFDNLNKDSLDVQNWLDSLDDSTNSTNRGRLYFMQPNAPTKVAYFRVTGSVQDGSGYRKVPVAPIICSSASIPFDSAAAVAIDFSPSGDAGLNGSGAGDLVGPAGATDGAIALFDTTTGKLLKNSGNGIGTSGANVGLLNGNNTYSGTASFTGAFAWSSTKIGTVANANALTLGPNGSTNPTLKVDTSTASAATGLQLKSAASTGGFAMSVLSSGTNENLTIDAKGSGTVTINGTGTGAIILSRATTISAALTYGGVALASAVTGTGNMVLSASPTLTGTITAAAATFSGTVGVGTTSTQAKFFALTSGSITADFEGNVEAIIMGAGQTAVSTAGTLTVISNSTAADGTGAAIILAGRYSGNNVASFAQIRGYRTGGSFIGKMALATRNASTSMVDAIIISDAQAVAFPQVGTTASAANAFLDNAASNNLLRSTSSIVVKRDIRAITLEEARRVVFGARPVFYRSLCRSDDPGVEWAGMIAEWELKNDSRFVHRGGADGRPGGVQYERYVAPLCLVVREQARKIAALEQRLAAA